MRPAEGAWALLCVLLVAASLSAQTPTVVLLVDLEVETAKVTHDRSEPLDLGGWTLASGVGGQTFTFPEGIRLAAGDTVTVTSGPDARDEPPAFLRWTGRYVWNNEGDPGALLDREGNVVARSQRWAGGQLVTLAEELEGGE